MWVKVTNHEAEHILNTDDILYVSKTKREVVLGKGKVIVFVVRLVRAGTSDCDYLYVDEKSYQKLQGYLGIE